MRGLVPTTLCLVGGAGLSVASSWLSEWTAPAWTGATSNLPTPAPRWPFPEEAVWSVKLAPPPGPTFESVGPRGPGMELRFFLAHTEEDDFALVEVRSGWPFRCMHRGVSSWCKLVWSLRPDAVLPPSRWYAGLDLLGNEPKLERNLPGPAFFPILQVWPGFALNTAFYGGLIALPVLGAPWARRVRRRRRGLCERCAYPRVGGICPECGRGAAPPPGQ